MPNVRNAEQIKAIIDARGIRFLLHFTQLSNLESILERGLLTQTQIEEQGLNCAINDEIRLDEHRDATCCSIDFPNYKMFLRLRKKPENAEVKWVIIAISPNILLEKDCVFCPTNAASGKITRRDVNDFKGVAALEAMFAEVEDKPSRAEMRQLDKYTTDPQAEVLVFDHIERKYILAVGAENKELVDELKKKCLNINIQCVNGLFKGRPDHQNW